MKCSGQDQHYTGIVFGRLHRWLLIFENALCRSAMSTVAEEKRRLFLTKTDLPVEEKECGADFPLSGIADSWCPTTQR